MKGEEEGLLIAVEISGFLHRDCALHLQRGACSVRQCQRFIVVLPSLLLCVED